MNDTYEGWVNRNTWAVALWLDNDYKLYVKYQAIAKQYKYRETFLASVLKNNIWMSSRSELPDGMLQDVGGFTGLHKVNWLEIASHMLASLYEDDLYNIAHSWRAASSILCPRNPYRR